MKKAFKKILSYWYIFLLLIPIIIITSIACKKPKDDIILVTFKKPYINITNHQDVEVKIPIYMEKKYNQYAKKANIINTCLKDKVTNDLIELKLIDIKEVNNSIKYQNKVLQKYEFNFTMLNHEDTNMEYQDACLELSYHNDEKHQLAIGSFTLLNLPLDNKLSIQVFKPIVNKIMPYQEDIVSTIVGIIIKIKNLDNEKIKITDFKLLNGQCDINTKLITTLTNIDYENDYSIKNIITDYQIDYQVTEDRSFDLLPNEELIFCLPISYKIIEPQNLGGLLIIYEREEIVHNQVIDPMLFFNSSDFPEKAYIYHVDQNN